MNLITSILLFLAILNMTMAHSAGLRGRGSDAEMEEEDHHHDVLQERHLKKDDTQAPYLIRCDTNRDCPWDQRCRSNICVLWDVECTADKQCPSDKLCDLKSYTCKAKVKPNLYCRKDEDCPGISIVTVPPTNANQCSSHHAQKTRIAHGLSTATAAPTPANRTTKVVVAVAETIQTAPGMSTVTELHTLANCNVLTRV